MTDNEDQILSLQLEVEQLKRKIKYLDATDTERSRCEQAALECVAPDATFLDVVQTFKDERASAHAAGYAKGYMARLAESDAKEATPCER